MLVVTMRPVALALVLVGVAACRRPAVARMPPEPETLPVVEPLAPPITIAIARPATGYDEDLPTDMHVDTISDGDRRPLHDRRLDAAAAELLEAVHQGAALSLELVQFVTHTHGIVEPPTFYMTQPPAEVLEPPNTRVGMAGDLTLVIHTGPVRFTALPRAIKGSYELRAALAPPYEHPRVTITGDDGSVAYPAVTVDGTAFRATITCAGTTSWVEVNADDEHRPLALVPVTCGTPLTTIRVEPERNLQTPNVERRLTALINRERIAAHLSPLHTDRRTAIAAERYARVMMGANDTAQDLAGPPQTRIADAGRRPLFVDETAFRADDLAQASLLLLNDPKSRALLLAKHVTHVGVGVAKSTTGELFVAIDYIEIPPLIDGAALEARVARQIIERRNTRRLLRTSEWTAVPAWRRSPKTFVPMPPVVDDELTDNARRYARLLAAGWSAATIDVHMNRALLAARRRYRHIGMERIEVTDPATVDESKRFADGAIVDAIGVGVAQSARDGWLSGRIYMVILYARY